MPMPTFTALPPSTEEIAAWLGEPNVEHVEGIRAWHGDATVLHVLEQLADAPAHDRAARFFALVDVAKAARRDAGAWPRGKCKDWYRPGTPVVRPVETGSPSPRAREMLSDTDERVTTAEAILAHTFADRPLLLTALAHASAGSDNNEAMACLGDRIYNAWAARRVFAGAPGAAKGRLTDAIIHLCRGETQAEVFFGLELHALLEVGGSVTWSGTITAPMASTALEAVVAALELDASPACAEAFLDRVCAGRLRTALAAITA